MKQISTALVKAQKAFAPALKNAYNPHFKNKYADLAACVEAVVDALNNNGIALVQKTRECVGGVMVETIFIHESGETLDCGVLHFPVTKNDPPAYMSALTYARRGSLMAACGIAPEDDDGQMATAATKGVDENALADHLAAIEASTDQEGLKAAYKAAYAACNGNANWQTKVINAKDEAKAKL
jgi:hypothetical protein